MILVQLVRVAVTLRHPTHLHRINSVLLVGFDQRESPVVDVKLVFLHIVVVEGNLHLGSLSGLYLEFVRLGILLHEPHDGVGLRSHDFIDQR